MNTDSNTNTGCVTLTGSSALTLEPLCHLVVWRWTAHSGVKCVQCLMGCWFQACVLKALLKSNCSVWCQYIHSQFSVHKLFYVPLSWDTVRNWQSVCDCNWQESKSNVTDVVALGFLICFWPPENAYYSTIFSLITCFLYMYSILYNREECTLLQWFTLNRDLETLGRKVQCSDNTFPWAKFILNRQETKAEVVRR